MLSSEREQKQGVALRSTVNRKRSCRLIISKNNALDQLKNPCKHLRLMGRYPGKIDHMKHKSSVLNHAADRSIFCTPTPKIAQFRPPNENYRLLYCNNQSINAKDRSMPKTDRFSDPKNPSMPKGAWRPVLGLGTGRRPTRLARRCTAVCLILDYVQCVEVVEPIYILPQILLI